MEELLNEENLANYSYQLINLHRGDFANLAKLQAGRARPKS